MRPSKHYCLMCGEPYEPIDGDDELCDDCFNYYMSAIDPFPKKRRYDDDKENS